MPMIHPARVDIADALWDAEVSRRSTDPPTAHDPDLGVDEAYAIQLHNIRRRLDAGAMVRGHKIGLTSRVMQELLGLDEPDYGHLLDDMCIDAGASVAADRFIQPMVEIEPAVVLRERLLGPGVSRADVARAVDWVVPAIEIIDSRVHGWPKTLVDTVADNGSSAAVVVASEAVRLADAALASQRARLFANGELAREGNTDAIMGDPLLAIAWLANAVGQRGTALEPGQVVLAGSCIAAVPVEPGTSYRASFDVLGTVEVTFT